MPLNSPFSLRLKTNYVPHPDEEDRIKDIVKVHKIISRQLDREVESIQRSIAALEARKRELLRKRDEHAVFAESHQHLLSSILHLPEDVMSLIFSHLVPTPEEWSVGRRFPPHPIVNLSHVCREWRAIALSIPGLWGTIFISSLPSLQRPNKGAFGVFESRMAHITDMISTLTIRASTRPMTVRLELDDQIFPFHNAHYLSKSIKAVTPLVDLLHFARWRDANISIYTSDLRSPFRKLLAIPSRSEDTIRTARFQSHLSIASTETLIVDNAKQLTSLEVSMSPVPQAGVIDVWVASATLADLNLLCGVPADDLPGILSGCPHLARCTVQLESWDFSIPLPTLHLPPVHLEHLHTLALIGHQPRDDLARSLTLPSLRSLSVLDTEYHHNAFVDTALLEWIRVHGRQLDKMEFSYARLDELTLASCLKGLPNVTSLAIRAPATRENLLIASFPRCAVIGMTPRADTMRTGAPEACWCPKLEKIVIDTADGEITAEEWVTFISLRRRLVGTSTAYLKELEVSIHAMDYGQRRHDSISRVVATLSRMGVRLGGVLFHLPRANHIAY